MRSVPWKKRLARRRRFTPEAYLKRRLRRSRWGGLILVLLLVGLVIADRAGWGFYQGSDLSRYDGKRFVVAEVIDGDTVDLAIGDGERATTRVRLWGINAPERAREGREAQPLAEEATQRTRDLVHGQWVTVSLQPHRLRGRYGRLLAYLTLADGTVLNEQLLIEGLARADGRWPHRDLNRYTQLEAQAQYERRGFWAEPPPSGAVRGRRDVRDLSSAAAIR